VVNRKRKKGMNDIKFLYENAVKKHNFLKQEEWQQLRALATDSLKESVSLHLGKKREKTIKTSHSRSPTFNLFHWVSTMFPNA
jgi:hypothetical protein